MILKYITYAKKLDFNNLKNNAHVSFKLTKHTLK